MDWDEATEILLDTVREEGEIIVRVETANGPILEVVHGADAIEATVKALLGVLRGWNPDVVSLLERKAIIE